MTDERDRPADRGPTGAVAADRIVGVYPAHAEPVRYGRGTTLFVVLVLIVLFLVFFGMLWFGRFPP